MLTTAGASWWWRHRRTVGCGGLAMSTTAVEVGLALMAGAILVRYWRQALLAVLTIVSALSILGIMKLFELVR
jgi:hypothetical protein